MSVVPANNNKSSRLSFLREKLKNLQWLFPRNQTPIFRCKPLYNFVFDLMRKLLEERTFRFFRTSARFRGYSNGIGSRRGFMIYLCSFFMNETQSFFFSFSQLFKSFLFENVNFFIFMTIPPNDRFCIDIFDKIVSFIFQQR